MIRIRIVPEKDIPKLVRIKVPIVGASIIEGNTKKALVTPVPKAKTIFFKVLGSSSITSVNNAPSAPRRAATVIIIKNTHKGS